MKMKSLFIPLGMNWTVVLHKRGKNILVSRAVTSHSLIDLFAVCSLGMLPGFVYNAACSTSQIGDCVALVRDYRSGL